MSLTSEYTRDFLQLQFFVLYVVVWLVSALTQDPELQRRGLCSARPQCKTERTALLAAVFSKPVETAYGRGWSLSRGRSLWWGRATHGGGDQSLMGLGLEFRALHFLLGKCSTISPALFFFVFKLDVDKLGDFIEKFTHQIFHKKKNWNILQSELRRSLCTHEVGQWREAGPHEAGPVGSASSQPQLLQVYISCVTLNLHLLLGLFAGVSGVFLSPNMSVQLLGIC